MNSPAAGRAVYRPTEIAPMPAAFIPASAMAPLLPLGIVICNKISSPRSQMNARYSNSNW